MNTKITGLNNYQHGTPYRIGVVLVNLGTPEAPTPSALRKYLREFLSDRRVVEIPRFLWMLILHGIILRVRPAKSALAYARVWKDDGSPLMTGTRDLTEKLKNKFISSSSDKINNQAFIIDFAMRYGKPSINEVLLKLHQQGAQKFIIVPLYPQYSGATSGSVADAAFKEFLKWRWVPELHLIGSYHDHSMYIHALTNSIRQYWKKQGQPQKLLISFHGMPRATLDKGDPYFCHCQKTARLLAQKLQLDDSQWELVFQSRFGKAEWLKPYVAERLPQLPKEGVTDIQIICPGFAIDCLETLDEINIEGREEFLKAGGEKFDYIPALNTTDKHVEFHYQRIMQLTQGFPEVNFTQEQVIQYQAETISLAKGKGAE